MNRKLELEARRDALLNKGNHNMTLIAKLNRKIKKIENNK